MCYICLDREFSVEQSNIYFTVIGQALQELWQFESRHANSRNLRVCFNTFYSRSSFLDYVGLRVNNLYMLLYIAIINHFTITEYCYIAIYY